MSDSIAATSFRNPMHGLVIWPADWFARTLLALLALSPLLGLGSAPLFDLDEGAFTASTLEMFLRDDFLSSYLLGEPRHDKPILIYWLQAASIALLGPGEFAFRLPSALASSLWILVTYAFVARVMDRRAALVAALVIATSAGLVVITRAATADALLNLWLACAGYAAWLWLKEDRPVWRLASFAAMGLGFLTKGPVAVLIPAGAVFLWCASRGDWRRFLRWAFNPAAIALFLAIAAPWFVVQTALEGPGFLHGFFFTHNLSRFDSAMEGHDGNYLYYLPVMLVSLLPHTGLLLAAARHPGSVWHDELLRYGLLWLLLVFVLFSFSGTKLPHYVYYGYGGLVLIMASAANQTNARMLALVPAVLAFVALFALPDLLAQAAQSLKADDRLLIQGLDAHFGLAWRTACGLALAVSLWLLVDRRIGLLAESAVNGVLAAGLIAGLLIPTYGEIQQGPVKAAGLVARDLPGPLIMQGINTPSFQTYAGRQVVKRAPMPGDLVLCRESRLEKLGPHSVEFRERSYVLARLR